MCVFVVGRLPPQEAPHSSLVGVPTGLALAACPFFDLLFLFLRRLSSSLWGVSLFTIGGRSNGSWSVVGNRCCVFGTCLFSRDKMP